jgi:hypothetical protein
MKTLIRLNEEDFKETLAEAINAGKMGERDRIVDALNNDAVITTCLRADWLEYIIRIVEEQEL